MNKYTNTFFNTKKAKHDKVISARFQQKRMLLLRNVTIFSVNLMYV